MLGDKMVAFHAIMKMIYGLSDASIRYTDRRWRQQITRSHMYTVNCRICGNESGLKFWVVDCGQLALVLQEATGPTVNTITTFNISRYWNTE